MSDKLKLAITKIGDLLLSEKITKGEDGKHIPNINLVIPVYQRPYKWDAKNVNQLLDDILDAKNANKETYRVGTLILHRDINENGETIYNIVDGQQRIITFSLLLKAIESNLPISFLEQSLSGNPYNKYNVPENFRILKKRIKNITDENEKKALLVFIQKKCELIVVITDDVSEAFQFFDSQNTRGKKLYPHDLLKAYHLREMNNIDATETEKTVKVWEDLNQEALSSLFNDYLYRVKEWTKGNKAEALTEHNIHIFKGITRHENYPYAQFYKGAYAYSDMVNNSAMPFVAGIRNINAFQLTTPIVAGKPFFDYTKHYFEILKDIQNNDKYEGNYISGNDIVNTLVQYNYKNGVGNIITRLLFDTAILLYVDRFCPKRPTKTDLAMLDQFVMFAFIWAYSLRAQSYKVGLATAQNYIMGISSKDKKINSFNIYKFITEADSPVALLSTLSGKVEPLTKKQIAADEDDIVKKNNGVFQVFLYFKINEFLEVDNGN